MKIQLCGFSGYRLQPGRGKTMVRTDGKVMLFLNSKCEAAYKAKKNPREIRWTVLYRRLHKKGVEEVVQKRRTRRNQKFQRAIVGASLTDIMAKRNMKPEVRKAQREQAIRAAKEKAKLAKGGSAPKAGASASAKPAAKSSKAGAKKAAPGGPSKAAPKNVKVQKGGSARAMGGAGSRR